MTRSHLALLVLLAACSPTPEGPAVDPSLEREILGVAAEYRTYGRVNDGNRWAPELCRLAPSSPRTSASADEATHGRKLYFLFARDRAAYVHGIDRPQPLGQAIVKESWEPVAVPAADAESWDVRTDDAGAYVPYVTAAGRRFQTGAKQGLFILLKRADGWTYATVTPDGRRVIQAGQIASCIGCHRDARPDSLFGLPPASPDR